MSINYFLYLIRKVHASSVTCILTLLAITKLELLFSGETYVTLGTELFSINTNLDRYEWIMYIPCFIPS